MPIPLNGKTFQHFDDAVNHLVKTKGYSKESAQRIVGSIEKHVKGASLYGAVPELSTANGKHYARFFLLNANVNSRNWNVTPDSIPEYIQSFKGMPYVSEPNLQHFGAEKMAIPQVFAEQEKYRAGTIVDVKYKPENGEAYAVVEVHDESVWNGLQKGEAIYVSPAVGGVGDFNDITGQVTFTKWYGIHLARVDKPAYGVMQASLKETCDGNSDFCVNHLMATASAGLPEIAKLALANNSYMCTMDMKDNLQPTSSTRKKSDDEINKSATALNDPNPPTISQEAGTGLTATGLPTNNEGHPTPGHLQTAKALNDIGDPDKRNTNVNPKTGDGMTTDRDGKKTGQPGNQQPEEDDAKTASEIKELRMQVAAMIEEKKMAIASEIVTMEKEAGLLQASEEKGRHEALMAHDKEFLESHIANFTPYYNKIMELSSKVPMTGRISQASRIVSMPATASEGRERIVTMDDARKRGLFD